jgi:putative transposase
MIEADNKELSIIHQCKILNFCRSNYYYQSIPKVDSPNEIAIMNKILAQYEKTPFYGHIKTATTLKISPKIARRLRKKLNLKTIYPSPNLSIPNQENKTYPYLLRDLAITRVNQVWESDITYIKLPVGSVYLTAVKDVFSRKLLSWQLSNTLDVDFCLSALRRAVVEYGIPEIFNTDQGSQYTSIAFTSELIKNKIQISMDGKGRAIDNIYIERFWRSLKYENIYINSYDSIKELEAGLTNYIGFFNSERIHQSLNYSTPNEIYFNDMDLRMCA